MDGGQPSRDQTHPAQTEIINAFAAEVVSFKVELSAGDAYPVRKIYAGR